MRFSKTNFPSVLVLVALLGAATGTHADDLKQELAEAFGKVGVSQRLDQRADQQLTPRPAAGEPSTMPAPEDLVQNQSDEMRYYIAAESHLRGKEGVPFPTQGEIVWDPDPPSWRAAVEEGRRRETISIPPKPYQRPSKCERNETKREILYPDSNEKEGDIIYDLLFLPENLETEESAEVFGKKTRLRAYGPGADPSVYTRMETHDVPCVPYRFRMTNIASYTDSGLNALRNYDKDPSGPGILHRWVQQEMFGKKSDPRPPRRR